MNGEMRE